jgi:hypothetical protein
VSNIPVSGTVPGSCCSGPVPSVHLIQVAYLETIFPRMLGIVSTALRKAAPSMWV